MDGPRGAGLDAEWTLLLRRLRLARGFSFIVYFVLDYDFARALQSRLRQSLELRGDRLVDIAVRRSGELVDGSLRALFAASDLGAVERRSSANIGQAASRQYYWLEALQGSGDPHWDTERAELLSRLNERRSRLEAELEGALILLLPATAVAVAATRAPDLWHVRTHSAQLGEQGDVHLPAAGTMETIVVDLVLPQTRLDDDEGAEPAAAPEAVADAAWPLHLSTLGDMVEPAIELPRALARGFVSGDKGFDQRMEQVAQALQLGAHGAARQGLELGGRVIDMLGGRGTHLRFDRELAQAHLLLLSARLAHAEGELFEARGQLEEALARLARHGMRQQSPVLDALGRVLQDLAEYDGALEVFARLGGGELESDPASVRRAAIARLRSAGVHLIRGDFRRALDDLVESTTRAHRLSDAVLESVLLTERGAAQIRRGGDAAAEVLERFDAALRCLDPLAPTGSRPVSSDAAPARREPEAWSAGKMALLCRQALLWLARPEYAELAAQWIRRADDLYRDEERRRALAGQRGEATRPMGLETLRLGALRLVEAAALARLRQREPARLALSQARAIYHEWNDERGERLAALEEGTWAPVLPAPG